MSTRLKGVDKFTTGSDTRGTSSSLTQKVTSLLLSTMKKKIKESQMMTQIHRSLIFTGEFN